MTRRFRFLETTVYIDFYLKVHVHDTDRGSETRIQPVRIPALLAWLMVQKWLLSRRWARGWTKRPKVHKAGRVKVALKVGQVWSLAWLYGLVGVNL